MQFQEPYPGIPEHLIHEQIQKIFSCPAFSVSDILKRFLLYIVRETLAGRANTIKEYTIGVNVLNKPADFSPQHDAIVRIHAGRLRRALQKYYREQAMGDSLLIFVPKGNYVPRFALMDQQSALAGNSVQGQEGVTPVPSIRIAVMPFRCYENDSSKLALADSLGQQMSLEFGHYPYFSVVAYYAAQQLATRICDIRDLGTCYGAQYVITGMLQFEGRRMRVSVQLSDVACGEQLWANQLDYMYDPEKAFSIQDDIVRQVVPVLGDFYGLLLKEAARNQEKAKKRSVGSSRLLVWYHGFYASLNGPAYHRALEAMQDAVREDPENDIAWAYFGELLLHGYLFNRFSQEDPVLQAIKYAQRALTINPFCQPAHITLAWANLYRRNKAACLAAIKKAVSINADAAGILGSAGAILICAGEYEEGADLISRSARLNKFYSPVLDLCMGLYYLKLRDYPRVRYWVEKSRNPDFIWSRVLLAVSGSEYRPAMDHGHDVGWKELNLLTREFFGKFILDEALAEQLHQGLHRKKMPALTVA